MIAICGHKRATIYAIFTRVGGSVASIRKVGTGWRAEVARQGRRQSKVFATKREAQDWAARAEYLILNGDKVASNTLFGDVMDRYAKEVSPSKRGERWEVIRLEKIGRDAIAKVRMGDLSASDFSDWRDKRLKEVTAGSVRREMILMSAVLTVARKDWGLIAANPMLDVRKPSSPPSRTRMPTTDDFEKMAAVAGDDLTKTTARAYHAFLFACETAMRAGEIVGLVWDRLDLNKAVARLEMTKNGTAREVPLSQEAVRLLRALPHAAPVFGLRSDNLDALFRSIKGRAKIEGLTFHDSRAYGTLKLSRKVDVMALARITGHKDLKMLMVYYRESAEDLAKRLG